MPFPISKRRWVFAALFTVLAALTFRLYPVFVYPFYAAQNDARIIVFSNVQKSIQNHIEKTQPALATDKKELYRQTELRRILKEEKPRFDKAVWDATWALYKLKSKAPRYLLEVDSFYYLALTKKVLSEGHVSDQFKDGRYFNPMMLAPLGHWYPLELHPYIGALFFRTASLFSPGVELTDVLSSVSPVLALTSLLIFFWLCRNVMGFTASVTTVSALCLTLAPIFLRRSLYGWYDTDAYNVLFPLLVWTLLFKWMVTEARAKRRLFLTLSAIVMASHTFFWRGWPLFYGLSLVGLVGAVSASWFYRDKERLTRLGETLLFILLPWAFILLAWGPSGASSMVREIKEFGLGFFDRTLSVWPDVFVSVGELRPSNFFQMSKLAGGLLIVLAGLGILTKFYRAFKEKSQKQMRVAASLFCFFIAAAFLGKSLERLSLIIVIPTALGVGLALSELPRWLKTQWPRYGVIAFLVLFVFYNAHKSVRYEHPIYNEVWDNAMTELKTNTPSDSIVTTWWSPGHFITGMAQRRVSFDGATQNTPQAYWVAKVFLESSEKKALSILRMLNLSGNLAYEKLEKLGLSPQRAIDLLLHILPLDKKAAEEVAARVIGQEEAALLVSSTHGTQEPPASYIFVYDNMIKQALSMEYIANWSFSKAENFIEFASKNPTKVPPAYLKRQSSEYAKLMWALSESPWVQDEEAYEMARDSEYVRFNNGLVVSQNLAEAKLENTKFGSGIPLKIIYMENGQLQERALPHATLRLSVLILKNPLPGTRPSAWRAVMGDEKLLKSMAFRLFYMNGEGLKGFKRFDVQDSAQARTRLYTYSVDWKSLE